MTNFLNVFEIFAFRFFTLDSHSAFNFQHLLSYELKPIKTSNFWLSRPSRCSQDFHWERGSQLLKIWKKFKVASKCKKKSKTKAVWLDEISFWKKNLITPAWDFFEFYKKNVENVNFKVNLGIPKKYSKMWVLIYK